MVYDELVSHDESGYISQRYTPITPESQDVRLPSRDDTGGTSVVNSTLTADGRIRIDDVSDIEIFEPVYLDYKFNPVRSATERFPVRGAPLSRQFHGNAILQLDVGSTMIRGKQYGGRLIELTRINVMDVSGDTPVLRETLSLDLVEAQLNYDAILISNPNLSAISARYPGQGLELWVTYTYTMVFQFLISGISEKQRWTSPFITKEADVQLTAPHWTRISPNDVFTLLSAEQIGEEVIDPSAYNDGQLHMIRSYFDTHRILEVVDLDGNYHDDVHLVGRNQVWWPNGAPNTRYTVQFLYHPSYTSIESFASLRNAENKAFVNKIMLKKWTPTNVLHRNH